MCLIYEVWLIRGSEGDLDIFRRKQMEDDGAADNPDKVELGEDIIAEQDDLNEMEAEEKKASRVRMGNIFVGDGDVKQEMDVRLGDVGGTNVRRG